MKNWYYCLGLLCSLLFASCHHKDLYVIESERTKVRVAYDWSEAPDALPDGMCVYFYSVSDGTYYRFDFKGTSGGEVELPAGTYVVLTFNNDTEAVQFSNQTDFYKHYAFTRTGDLLEPLYGNGVTSTATTDDNERVVITPDELWGCSATEITIVRIVKQTEISLWTRSGSGYVSSDSLGNQTVTLRPHDMLCHYSYEVRNVRNASHISKVSGALSGMSPTLRLCSDELDTETVTLPVSGTVHTSNNTITGQFLTFGHNASSTVPNKMSFYVVMDDGSKYVVKGSPNLVVTDQVRNAPDPRHVHIIIDGLNIPDPQSDGNGFDPYVQDWGEINEDIKI